MDNRCESRFISGLAGVSEGLWLAAGIVVAAGGMSASWSVIGGGGGPVVNGSYALDATVGEAVAGEAANSPTVLCSGFWCEPGMPWRVYVPLVRR